MKLDSKLTLGFFVVLAAIEHGWSLKCYECSSYNDDLCGKTWGYEAGSTKYLTDCVGELVACKKLEYEDKQQGGMIVTRSCWNNTDTHQDFDMKCRGLFRGHVCYCHGEGNDPCNEGQLLQPHSIVTFILAGLSTLLFVFHLR